jgi:hypothetical protein
MGHTLDFDKIVITGRCANVDQVDAAPLACGSANELVLEGINAISLFMYADIRHMAIVVNVVC